MAENLPPYLYMMVGLPGSGKSTTVKKLLQKPRFSYNEVVILSTDAVIEREAEKIGKLYSQVFEDFIKLAERQISEDLADALDAYPQRDIIWDQTNLSIKGRAKKLARIPKNYLRVAYVHQVGRIELQERLDKRQAETGKYIAPKIVDSMATTFEYPIFGEGFIEIVDVK